MLHQHDQLDLAALVDPVAGTVLGRVQESELAFPVAKHMGFEIGQRADFADRIEFLDWSGRGHFHCSALSSRAMSSVIPSRAAFPLNRTSPTFSMMGSSTPIRLPSAAPAL